jgi:protein involved in polysaccharide export with SLBB domain
MRRLCLALALTLLPVGCATWDTETILPQQLPPDLQATAVRTVDLLQLAALGAPVEAEQRIQPGDLLEVTVSDLTSENAAYPIPVRVQGDGTIRLPLVGSVPVGTLTLPEAEQCIFASYTTQGYLRKPQVLVSLRETRKLRVYVLGAVNKPGQIELKGSESDLLTALVAAGGLTRDAGSHLQIHRRIVAPLTPPSPLAAGGEGGVRGPARWSKGRGTPLTRRTSPESAPVLMPALSVSRQGGSPALLDESAVRAGSAEGCVILPPLTVRREAGPVMARRKQLAKSDGELETAAKVIQASAYQPAFERPTPAHSFSPKIMDIDLASATDKHTLAQGITLENGDTIVVEQRKVRGIYVIGMVNKPGEINVPPDRSVHVLEAVGMAGGVDRMSLPNKAVVIRAKPEDSGLVAVRIDLDRAKRDMNANLLLMPGDTVSVEETPMSYVRGLLRGALRIGLGLDVAPALSLY